MREAVFIMPSLAISRWRH